MFDYLILQQKWPSRNPRVHALVRNRLVAPTFTRWNCSGKMYLSGKIKIILLLFIACDVKAIKNKFCIWIKENFVAFQATFDWYLKTDQLYESHLESESALSMLNVHLDKANANAVEKRLGYSFKNRFLLLQALTHGSYSSNVLTSSFESLEVKNPFYL